MRESKVMIKTNVQHFLKFAFVDFNVDYSDISNHTYFKK